MVLIKTSLWALASLQLAASLVIGGCPGPIVTDHGFNVSIYNYPPRGQQGFNPDGTMNKEYYQGGYKNYGGKYDSVTGLTDINFYDLNSKGNTNTVGTLYGKKVIISSFALEFEGYYLAPEDGEYTIYLAADDQISLQLGRGSECCGDFDNGLITDQYQVGSAGDTYEHAYENNKGVTLRTNVFTMKLTKGLYYPIKMVYFNAVSSYVLQTSILEPSGLNNTNWACDIYQLDTNSRCPKMTTRSWTGTFTTETTKTNSLTSSTEIEIIIETPGGPGNATTPTTPGTGSFVTTSKATEVNPSSISGTPSLRKTSKIWTNPSTSKRTTATPATITSKKTTYPSTSSVVVNTPVLSTVTEPWTGSSTSSFTTITPVTVTSGSSVYTTQSSIVVVVTPTPVLSNSTKLSTRSSTSKFTSGSSVYATTSSAVVDTSTPVLSNVTKSCNGSSTSTFATVTPVTVTSGSSVYTTQSSAVVVDTPKASSTSIRSKPSWVTSVPLSTVTSTSNTYSTAITSLGMSSGNYTQTAVTVEIPGSASSVSTSVDRNPTNEIQSEKDSETSIASAVITAKVTQSSGGWASESRQTDSEISQTITSSRESSAKNNEPQQSNPDQNARSSIATELPSGPKSVETTAITQSVSRTQTPHEVDTFSSESSISQATAKTESPAQPEPVQSSSAEGSRNISAPSQPSSQPQQSSNSQASGSGSSIAVEGPSLSGSQPISIPQSTSFKLTNAGSRAYFAFKPRNIVLGLIVFGLI